MLSGVSIHRRALKRLDAKGRKQIVYDVHLRDRNSRMYQRTFAAKEDAKRFEADEIARRASGTWTDLRHAKLTVTQLGERWLASNPAKRSGTRARDRSILDRHITPALGSRAIGSVAQPDIQSLVNAWAACGAARTVKRQYDVLRATFRYAVDADFLSRSPCRDIKLPESKPVRRRMPTTEQLTRLADELGPSAGMMMWTAVLTGLRWGEVAGLRVGSVDLLRGELRVIEQRTRDLAGDDVTAEPKSSAGVRTLSIPAVLVEMIAGHLAGRKVTAADPMEFVFVGERGGPTNYSHFRQRVWEPACDRAGLPELTFHDLRRCNATAMVAEKVDLKTAQTRAGHSDPRLTIGLYAQVVTEADRAASDSLAARLFPGVSRG
jgi:integrase